MQDSLGLHILSCRMSPETKLVSVYLGRIGRNLGTLLCICISPNVPSSAFSHVSTFIMSGLSKF